jgi:phosphate transport system permease protein
MMREWFKSGTPWIWLNAGAIAIALVAVFGLLSLVMVRGMSHFWVDTVYEMQYDSKSLIAEIVETETVPANRIPGNENAEGEVTRHLVKTGNRDLLGSDFRWIFADKIESSATPEDLVVLERLEWGNFYGFLKSVHENDQLIASGDSAWAEFEQRLERVIQLREEITDIERDDIGSINYDIERLRLKQRRYEIDGALTDARKQEIEQQRAELNEQYAALQVKLSELYKQIRRDSITTLIMDGREISIPIEKIVKAWQPNQISFGGKILFYIESLWSFMTSEPREANTEGGIFPAIFGTVMMVILMSIMVTPLGVIAAVYLREYARQGLLIRLIRIAVNNLAGVPSIVYGIFGLGFFVYFLGGSIDALFYPEAQPAPTFGTPGLMWSSLTLAILTLPVVIVATEEGLARIPRSLREGSLALGATKAETIWRVVLPMSSPAIMTGLILAIARAAGEVAPLMLVGVVKLAPTLPVDGNFPFLHLERKFMHLGFHIYDVGFQSPNVEAARPLVYATAFLLVVVIVVLNLSAIHLRNRLRERYRALDN